MPPGDRRKRPSHSLDTTTTIIIPHSHLHKRVTTFEIDDHISQDSSAGMPQSYHRRYSDYPPSARIPLEPRRRSSYALAPATSPQRDPQLMDADDSIVLSDLIRTGEQSRLRRRGAMRVDHTTAGPRFAPLPIPASLATIPDSFANIPTPLPILSNRRGSGTFARPPSTPPSFVPNPLSGQGDDDAGYTGYSWNMMNDEDGIALEYPSADEQRAEEDAEESFILYCGGEEGGLHPGDVNSQQYKPSILPWTSVGLVSARSTPTPPSSKTNGCGAVVHVRAFPQKTRGVWLGKEEATDVVVAMDQTYFEHTGVVRMMKSACGCVREGIGCAICGNPLGTRYMPCQAASQGLFNNGSHSSSRTARPSYPSGPRYWQATQRSSTSASPEWSSSRSSTPRPTGGFYVYTFFSNQVSSSPTRNPPLTRKTSQRSPEVVTADTSSADAVPLPIPAEPTWLGISPSASPMPYSPTFAPSPPLIRTGRHSFSRSRSRSRSRSPVIRPPGLMVTIPAVQPTAPTSGSRSRPPMDAVEIERLDPDGVPIEDTEPSSPDKTGNDGVLWSGR
ncbi:hypothetical protein BDW22DRAFT_1433639 [Trametopsis cervina]|nr:hypothetical protein BDW22DRAFT_1433639 [Trametopsis cervina]